jgi:hypothetical protein
MSGVCAAGRSLTENGVVSKVALSTGVVGYARTIGAGDTLLDRACGSRGGAARGLTRESESERPERRFDHDLWEPGGLRKGMVGSGDGWRREQASRGARSAVHTVSWLKLSAGHAFQNTDA